MTNKLRLLSAEQMHRMEEVRIEGGLRATPSDPRDFLIHLIYYFSPYEGSIKV